MGLSLRLNLTLSELWTISCGEGLTGCAAQRQCIPELVGVRPLMVVLEQQHNVQNGHSAGNDHYLPDFQTVDTCADAAGVC